MIGDLSKMQIEGIMNLHQIDIIDWKKQLELKNKKIADLKNSVRVLQEVLNEFGNVDISKLEQEIQYWKQKYEKDINKIRLESAIEIAIVQCKAKNNEVLKALLNVKEISLADNGLIGFNEQINELSKEYEKLFYSDQ